MESIKVTARKWGNSLGFILPKKIIDKRSIRDGMEILIKVEPVNKMTVGDLMALARKRPLPSKLNVKKILETVDKEFWPEDE